MFSRPEKEKQQRRQKQNTGVEDLKKELYQDLKADALFRPRKKERDKEIVRNGGQ
jgi:hypothetical protein